MFRWFAATAALAAVAALAFLIGYPTVFSKPLSQPTSPLIRFAGPITKRRPFQWFAATAALGAMAGMVFVFGYPALFPEPLSQPSFNLDPAEGKVWTNSEVVVEVRGNLTAEEAVRTLNFRPPVALHVDDVQVEHSARLPGHEGLPWATTRITVNSGRGALFAADTKYTLELDGHVAQFETITMPAVLAVYPAGDPRGSLEGLPTSREIMIVFNERVTWDASLLKIEPPVAVTTSVESLAGGETAVRIKPPGRWENSTRYALTIAGAVRDLFGHTAEVAFSAEFGTWAQPKVLTVAPQGESQPVESALQVEFERNVDRASVQAAFHIEPAVGGTFEWQSERLLLWRPQGLQHSTWYRASVGGKALGGDTFVGAEWSFRTQDPPVFVEIKGRDQAPTVLEAFPSGGLGNYALQWSTGETERRILFPGAPAQAQDVTVTVRSGDRTATKSMQIAAAPANGFTPSPCPTGWYLLEVSVCYRAEELPGPVKTYAARVDLRNPNLQVRSALAAETLGRKQPTSEQARATNSLIAVNGDFFYNADHGSYPLGPVSWGGSLPYAPASPEIVLALGQDHNAWIGPATELRFAAESLDGSSLSIQGINDIPAENAVSLFNSYWGPELTLGAEGCFATFSPTDHNMRMADSFGCGPLANVPLPAGAYVLVGRGAAAEWMQQQSMNALMVGYSFPLPNVHFIVAGSPILIRNSEKPALEPDRRGPRTAIGVDGNGFLYLVVVDGRSEQSVGMSRQELQAHVAQLGLNDAINLDGGGSSTMVVAGTVVNSPSDGQERPVASIIEVGPPRPNCWHPFVRC